MPMNVAQRLMHAQLARRIKDDGWTPYVDGIRCTLSLSFPAVPEVKVSGGH